MNERVLRRLKEYLDIPDGKYTDEHIVNTHEGSSIEAQIEISIALEDAGIVLEDLGISLKDIGKTLDNMFPSWKDIILSLIHISEPTRPY